MSKQLPEKDLFEDTKMSFGEHLEELRVALFRAVVGLFLGFLIGLAIADRVVKFIELPLRSALETFYLETDLIEFEKKYGRPMPEEIADFMTNNRLISEGIFVEASEFERLAHVGETPATDGVEAKDIRADSAELPMPSRRMIKTRIWRNLKTRITALSAQEAFMIWLKAAFISGLLIASPYIFWQIWIFVAAGLYPHERRYVKFFLPFSLALFWGGAAMAFFLVFDFVLRFLFSFNRSMEINPDPRISEWIGFVMFLPLGFGIAFQLPLVMLFLNRIGIFTVEVYLKKWRIAILVIFVLSMLLTPADPISMLLLAAPMTGLYFLGVALCQWLPRGRNPFDEGYEPA